MKKFDWNILERLGEFEKGFLCGLIEGEGWLGFFRIRSKGNTVLHPGLAITNTKREILEYAKKLAKVGLINKRYKTYSSARKPLYTYNVRNNLQLFWLLEQIEPYLISKKRQAQLILEFLRSRIGKKGCEIVQRDSKGRIIYARHHRYTERERELYRKVMAINKRG